MEENDVLNEEEKLNYAFEEIQTLLFSELELTPTQAIGAIEIIKKMIIDNITTECDCEDCQNERKQEQPKEQYKEQPKRQSIKKNTKTVQGMYA